MQNNVVKVLLHDEEVGRLYWDVKQRRAVFSFAPSFVSQGLDIAPLTASVKVQVSQHMQLWATEKNYFKDCHLLWLILFLIVGAIRCLSSGHASIRLDFYCKFRRRIL